MKNSVKSIKQLFKDQRVVDMPRLQQKLGNKSARSVFRYLAQEAYYSSFTYAGKYYALKGTPKFNELGIWFYDEVGFSKHGTLKQTLIFIINNSESGKTHAELKSQLLVRVHNTLLALVQQIKISRTEVNGIYIYTAAGKSKKLDQINKRQSLSQQLTASPSGIIQIEILVEIIRLGKFTINSCQKENSIFFH